MPTKSKHIVLIHWDANEAQELANPLNKNWTVTLGIEKISDLKAEPPRAVVISLRRSPSHGREVADAIWQTKWGQEIPIVFFDGVEDKVEATKRKFPEAVFTSREGLDDVLQELT